MTAQALFDLGLETIRAPRLVARHLMGIRMSREALLTAFALVVVANAALFGVGLVLDPPPSGVPVFLASPVGYLLVEAVSLAGTIMALTWVGRLLGGAGRMADVALLLIWLQALNIAVQAVTTLALLALPVLAGLIVMLAFGIGLWIMVNFIDEAHGLGSPFKAFLVLVLSVVALGFVLSVILVFAGVTPEGMMGNV